MNKRSIFKLLLACSPTCLAQTSPSTMPRIAHVDPRFQSYNIEMVEVIGGRFWKPYDSTTAAQPTGNGSAAGIDPSLFEQRKPIDLTNPRLRTLAAALGPAYVRVSGTWANNVFFQNNDAPAPAQPPTGFGGTLTRAQWRGVLDFSKAVNARLVTSFSVSASTRDAHGVWTPTQAQSFITATQQLGGNIAAAEFINEPSFPSAAGLNDYSATDFARDFKIFRSFIRTASPNTIILGPGSVGEGIDLAPAGGAFKVLSSKDMLSATGANTFDAFSYHFYGAVSSRCSAAMSAPGTTPQAAMTEDWLSRTSTVEAFYAKLRDQYDAGKPMWLTETGQAACGGDRWASTFLDSFRYLDQLGRLAQKNVQVVMHNTLAASDYALIDDATLTPRPNYWAALLWHRTMGTTVLDPGPLPAASTHLYAHCSAQGSGVTLLALNLDPASPATIRLDKPSERYTLTSSNLQSHEVSLNNTPLTLASSADIPTITGAKQSSGDISLPPASISFFVIAGAHNPACSAQK